LDPKQERIPTMELWTEYEGRVIDGAYPLTKLLQPEGRSAFFATSNGTGEPMVIRLIESHFDDEEILGRWRGIAALNHPNLIRLKKFGRAELDETSLVYAVIEPVDTNLAEMVGERRLTLEETRQLAGSLVDAVDALHSNGFVHEHVAPQTVLAVGEVIKLRSDCIREAPEGEEGRWLKHRDVHDLALVLLEALTQQKTMEDASRELPLPAPFDEIVDKGVSGAWGITQIREALESADSPKAVVRETVAPVAEAIVREAPVAAVETKPVEAAPRVDRIQVPVATQKMRVRLGAGAWAALGVVGVLVMLLAWLFLRKDGATKSSAPQDSSVTSPAVGGSAREAPVAVAAPGVKAPAAANGSAAPVGERWRVVAFTYNHEEQAKEKAQTVARRYPNLHPEVFSPSGHAPYLVTLGGAMSRDEAFALVRTARSEGLPHDIYAQNYKGQGR
jgi:eukaryotic-like serine/threonine-protein kinase